MHTPLADLLKALLYADGFTAHALAEMAECSADTIYAAAKDERDMAASKIARLTRALVEQHDNYRLTAYCLPEGYLVVRSGGATRETIEKDLVDLMAALCKARACKALGEAGAQDAAVAEAHAEFANVIGHLTAAT